MLVIHFARRYLTTDIPSIFGGFSQQNFRIRSKNVHETEETQKFGICTRTKYVLRKFGFFGFFGLFWIQVKMRCVIGNFHGVRFSGNMSCR